MFDLSRFAIAVILASTAALPARAQHTEHAQHHPARNDSAYRAMQERGRVAMGVDQYTSTHHFDKLADGGRIELQRDSTDSAGTAVIRAHLRAIRDAFTAGDFSTPAFVHLQDVPGTKTMAARRSFIRYTVTDLPRGAVLRITTTDAEALRAVHEFLTFQGSEHAK